MSSRARDRRAGIALMLVLVLVVMASVLGMTYLSVASIKLAGANNLRHVSRARYLAESGLHHAMCLLRRDPAALKGYDAVSPMGPFYADGSDDAYFFYVTGTGIPLTYTAKARGCSGGVTQASSAEVRLSSRYKDQLSNLGPIAYWRLGELSGTVAKDLAGSNDGAYGGGALLGRPGALAGDIDRSVHFDGHDDRVDLGRMDLSGQTLTIAAWFKAQDFVEAEGRIISKATGLGNSDHYWMISTVNSGGNMRLRFRLKCDGYVYRLTATSGDLEVGKWTFVVATYNGSRMRLYKDTVDVGSRSALGSISTDDDVNSWIGGNPSSPTDAPFHGQIDEVAIFNKVLTTDQILALYEARIASVEILSWDK